MRGLLQAGLLHLVALSLLLLGLGCTQEEVVVRTAAGEESAVGRYSTFGILLPDPQDLKDEGMKIETLQKIASLSIEELKARGYRPTPPDKADLLIVFGPRVTIYGNTRVESSTGYYDPKYDQTQHAQGTLTVAFLDAKTHGVLLTRVAETRLLMGGPSDEKMRKGVAQLFEPIPRAALAATPATSSSAKAAVAPGSPASAVPPAAPPPTAVPPNEVPPTADATPAPK
jgi:hypothetical protein